MCEWNLPCEQLPQAESIAEHVRFHCVACTLGKHLWGHPTQVLQSTMRAKWRTQNNVWITKRLLTPKDKHTYPPKTHWRTEQESQSRNVSSFETACMCWKRLLKHFLFEVIINRLFIKNTECMYPRLFSHVILIHRQQEARLCRTTKKYFHYIKCGDKKWLFII